MEQLKTEPTLSEANYSPTQAGKTKLLVAPYESLYMHLPSQNLCWAMCDRHPPTNQIRRSRMEKLKTEPTLSEAKHMVYSRSQAGKTKLVVAPYMRA